jgi:uncharacterized protein with PIN domain
MKQLRSTSKIREIIDFFRSDFWNFMRGMPKCKERGYCNTEVSNYRSQVVRGLNESVVLQDYRYRCSKCNKDISKHFEDEYWWRVGKSVRGIK